MWWWREGVAGAGGRSEKELQRNKIWNVVQKKIQKDIQTKISIETRTELNIHVSNCFLAGKIKRNNDRKSHRNQEYTQPSSVRERFCSSDFQYAASAPFLSKKIQIFFFAIYGSNSDVITLATKCLIDTLVISGHVREINQNKLNSLRHRLNNSYLQNFMCMPGE